MIGILLAGGQALRLGGGDKGARRIGGRSIIDRVVARMSPQCDALIVNANGDDERFSALGLPVVSDGVPDQPGPLAGVLAGLDYVAAHHPQVRFAVTVPTDAPFLPDDLVARLQDARRDRPAGTAHYVCTLWSVDLRHDIERAISHDRRQVGAFVEAHPYTFADWPVHPFDPFFNVNTPADLDEAERIAAML